MEFLHVRKERGVDKVGAWDPLLTSQNLVQSQTSSRPQIPLVQVILVLGIGWCVVPFDLVKYQSKEGNLRCPLFSNFIRDLISCV